MLEYMTFYSVPFIDLSTLCQLSSCVDYLTSTISLEIRQCSQLSHLIFLVQSCFSYFRSFALLFKFQNQLQFVQMSAGILTGNLHLIHRYIWRGLTLQQCSCLNYKEDISPFIQIPFSFFKKYNFVDFSEQFPTSLVLSLNISYFMLFKDIFILDFEFVVNIEKNSYIL